MHIYMKIISYAGGGSMFCRCCFLYFKCRPCHSTTGGQIAARIVALTPSMKKITTANNLVNLCQGTLPWQPILWRETAKIDFSLCVKC